MQTKSKPKMFTIFTAVFIGSIPAKVRKFEQFRQKS
jgi:hypothetical protein